MTKLTSLLTFLTLFALAAAKATTVFPSAAGSTTLSKPMVVTGVYDGKMKRFERNNGCRSGEGGDADAVFHVQAGGTLQSAHSLAVRREKKRERERERRLTEAHRCDHR
jgi:hypothetical protein